MPPSWVGPYVRPVPVRCRGGLHFYRAEDPAADRAHLVVLAPYLTPREARSRLGGLARAHELVAGPGVPGVIAQSLEGAQPWVALACDVVADFEVVVDHVRHGAERPPYERTASVGRMLMETLRRCHDVRDPETGNPVCLGSMSTTNLMVAADGSLFLVGFGSGPLAGAFMAPEVAAGGVATPGADVHAITLFLRAQMPYTRLPSVVGRVFSGTSLRTDARLVALLAWSNLKILAGPPRHRPSMAQALARAQELWARLGFEPDAEGFRQFAAEAVAAEPRRLADASQVGGPARLVIRKDGEWIESPDGRRYALGHRGPLRRVLVALARAQATRAALTVDDLLRAGWPGENPLPAAAQNRVWVTISTLRKLGLGDLLQRWDGGYRLDPAVPCTFEPS